MRALCVESPEYLLNLQLVPLNLSPVILNPLRFRPPYEALLDFTHDPGVALWEAEKAKGNLHTFPNPPVPSKQVH